MKPKKTAPGAKGTSSAKQPSKAKSARPASKPAKGPADWPTLPPFLLEGDTPEAPTVSGPGEKYALGPRPPEQAFESGEVDLPSAYGTKRLFLLARDPHWLYAHWDLTREQQHHYNGLSADKHLVLRVFKDSLEGSPITEVHVHPESKHWFVHVEQPGAKYFADLGYYEKKRSARVWTAIATSAATLTPPNSLSPDVSLNFATIPVQVPFVKLVAMVKAAARENLPLAQALEELRLSRQPQLPVSTAIPSSAWTPNQERALMEVITLDQSRRVWIGSMEITELLRRKISQEVSSQGVAEFGGLGFPGEGESGFGGPSGEAVTSPSSAFSPSGGAMPRPKDFWFMVNAELVIYGATDPNAAVTIGGRPIKLRPDGSFSYRFALPDGRYDMPAVAVSPDGTDARAAELMFSRTTEFRGDVEVHPQDPSLKPPTPDNL